MKMIKKAMTYSEVKAALANLITQSDMSNATFDVQRKNTVGLLDKVAKIVTYDTDFEDDLAWMDGEFLSFGKIIEEWAMDLMLTEDEEINPATESNNWITPEDPHCRPTYYSYSVGGKKRRIKTTIRYDDLERAVHFADQYASLIAMKYKRLSDSRNVERYSLKKEALAKYIKFCEDESTTTTVFAVATAYNVGTIVKKDASATKTAIVFNEYAANKATDYADAIKKGYLVELDLLFNIEVPKDTATSEAFIKQVKKDVEKATKLSQGHSLNGNALGASKKGGLVLFLRTGIMPELDVEAFSGAFHEEKLALPAEIQVLEDFGSNESAFAVLMDRRAIKYFPSYIAVREDSNGYDDYMNVTSHEEGTMAASRNVFVRVYTIKESA